MAHAARAKGQMEMQREPRGLRMRLQFTSQIHSYQRRSPGAPEVPLGNRDSTASPCICTDSSGKIISAPRFTYAQHSFGLVWEALARRQRATQALREGLYARKDSNNSLLVGIKEDINVLPEQREALQEQVGELTAAPRESQELVVHKAQREGSEALESPAVALEEKKLSLRSLEGNSLAWSKQTSQLRSALQRSEQLLSDRVRELQELNSQIRSLQEAMQDKDAAQAAREEKLLQELQESRAGERRLRDSVQALEAEVSELRSRLRSSEDRAEALATQCQQASSAHCQAQSQLDKLLLAVHRAIRDSSSAAAWSPEKGHVVSLTASQAGDVPTELAVDGAAAALQDLWQQLECSQKDLNKARKKIRVLKLQLSTTQAQRDCFSARNQELQKQLADSQEATRRAEGRNSLEAALREEAAARREEAVALQQELESLQRKLEHVEKERKDVLHEWDSLQANNEELERQIKLLEEPVTASESQAIAAMDRNHSLQELRTIISIFQVKKEKLEAQEKKLEMLQKEAEEAQALQGNLTRVTADLSEREREIRLYREQMRMLEKKNLMHITSLQRKELNQMRRETEREAMREKLEHMAAALKQRENRELEWRKKAQALGAALAKSEMSKGSLRKKLTILQRTAASRDTDCSFLQAAGEEGKWLSLHAKKGLECVLGLIAPSEEKTGRRELKAEPSRNLGQVEHRRRSRKGRCRHQERESFLSVRQASKELK
ncbi:centrosome-associated protein CEP250-like isoform X2 [Cyanistes caeruleus]|uniref:centrosome-associated protein CEP250-like isoform X1 n=1 Tax=Cyanistes caeruleus TaxID=156563 RepID=UPI000CDA73C5|nr:centrosome-associated protein CEP250-like isoform X1 [Cyanistes caeruleus]XP_023793677.1 centrosome-associated protein CEP250-like isoform X2 [Cyanistes caeruleus]